MAILVATMGKTERGIPLLCDFSRWCIVSPLEPNGLLGRAGSCDATGSLAARSKKGARLNPHLNFQYPSEGHYLPVPIGGYDVDPTREFQYPPGSLLCPLELGTYSCHILFGS